MVRKPSDRELVERTLRGDTDAFATLVYRYQNVAYVAAYSLVHDFHEARDITQEAWIKAYQRLAIYDPGRNFGAWLYMISRRCALDYLRSRQRISTEELSAADDVPDPKPQPDAELVKQELHQTIRQALATLSEANRETTMLYYIDGYSQREVSAILGVPLGTVKRRLHDSRKVLRKEVLRMVEETLNTNKLTWQFTQDVVNRVSELKENLADYLPEEFRTLARMSNRELEKRRNRLLRSLAEVLSISVDEVGLEDRITLAAADLSEEQKEYLWQTLHELELMDILSTIMKGSAFRTLIQDFNNVRVEIGRYPSLNEEIHGNPYVRLYRPTPEGSAHSIQMGLI